VVVRGSVRVVILGFDLSSHQIRLTSNWWVGGGGGWWGWGGPLEFSLWRQPPKILLVSIEFYLEKLQNPPWRHPPPILLISNEALGVSRRRTKPIFRKSRRGGGARFCVCQQDIFCYLKATVSRDGIVLG